MLRDMNSYFPTIIKSKLGPEGKELYINDFNQAKKLLDDWHSLPKFININHIGVKEEFTKEYSMIKRAKVAELDEGKSFGELALITNLKRNATIKAMTDTHFAVSLKILKAIDYEKACF